MNPFVQRAYVYAFSDYRPLGDDKRPIGSAVTELGAKRVYWQWEQQNFPQGSRWYPVSMVQQSDRNGNPAWYLGHARKL